jgi:glycerol-3-phosphate O-acyltransferase / dihydroxyacetone phosphate acyltransferase
MLRRALVATFRGIIRLYFRQIERFGEPPGPETRGRMFVCNHHNALIDPVLVLTDAQCEISPIAKSTLWNIPGLKYLLDGAGAVPLYRRKDDPNRAADANDAVFAKIAEHLATGGNLLIFPEGTSHSQPHLAPLRTGAARMLLAGEKQRRALTFQAVALEFDEREQFRSRCLVLWGPVRRLADVGGDGEERVQGITAQMEADLSDLLVEGKTHDDRRLVARVAEMLANDSGDDSLAGWSQLGRQVEAAGEMLRTAHPDLVAGVREKIEIYYEALARSGRSDAELAERVGARTAITKSRSRWVRRIALAPLAVPGFVLYGLPYFIPRLVARSSDPDAVSTIKLGTALVVYPVWAAMLVGASFVFIPPPLSFVAAVIVIASPFAALSWLDAYWNRRSDRELTPDEVATLARLRIAARTAIEDARAHL